MTDTEGLTARSVLLKDQRESGYDLKFRLFIFRSILFHFEHAEFFHTIFPLSNTFLLYLLPHRAFGGDF
jgi:hypothetical protein